MEIENPEHYFYVSNGAVLRSLNDVISELHSMDKASFSHHVNTEKNDFSTWIRDVFKDKALAKKIANAKSKEEMISLVEKRISAPSKKEGKRSKKEIISSIKETIANGK